MPSGKRHPEGQHKMNLGLGATHIMKFMRCGDNADTLTQRRTGDCLVKKGIKSGGMRAAQEANELAVSCAFQGELQQEEQLFHFIFCLYNNAVKLSRKNDCLFTQMTEEDTK
jgi:hypothetical protein